MKIEKDGKMQKGCGVHLSVRQGHTHQSQHGNSSSSKYSSIASVFCFLPGFVLKWIQPGATHCTCMLSVQAATPCFTVTLLPQHFVRNHRTRNGHNIDKPCWVGVKIEVCLATSQRPLLWVDAFFWFEPAVSCIWLLLQEGGSLIYRAGVAYFLAQPKKILCI